MASSQSATAKTLQPDQIEAFYDPADDQVRWISSNEFFIRQMEWCLESVTSYWQWRVRKALYEPCEIPMTIRFCVSFLSGIDCTGWTVRELLAWFYHRFGRGRKFTSVMHIAWKSQRGPTPILEATRAARRGATRAPRKVRLPAPVFLWRVETWLSETPPVVVDPVESRFAVSEPVPDADADVERGRDDTV